MKKIKYRPVGNYSWRDGEILAMSYGKARIRILDPLLKGSLIQLNHPMLPEYAEIIEQQGCLAEIYLPNNLPGDIR